MIINTVIKQAAEISVITSISAGDIYKRLETPSYGGPRVVLGIVTDVLQNGEQAAVTAIEFIPPEYGAVEPKMVTFAGDAEVSIYPVARQEFVSLIAALEERQASIVETAERDLTRKSGVLNQIRSLQQQGVTEAGTKTITA